MDLVLTGDGSYTLRNTIFNECYHSKSGAFEEALHKFVIPCAEKFSLPALTIYDVCFGLGYNTAAALQQIWNTNPTCAVTVYAFENDQNLLATIKYLPVPEEFALVHSRVCAALETGYSTLLHLVLITNLQFPKEKADIVFWDPFSPRRCPNLWTEELLQSVYTAMNPNGILTTYSCASVVRKNLQLAGFAVHDGPRIGRRSPSTIAYVENSNSLALPCLGIL